MSKSEMNKNSNEWNEFIKKRSTPSNMIFTRDDLKPDSFSKRNIKIGLHDIKEELLSQLEINHARSITFIDIKENFINRVKYIPDIKDDSMHPMSNTA